MIRDLFVIVWTAGGFWLLRHDLFEREPQEHQAAALHPSSDLHLGVDPGEHAPSRSETYTRDIDLPTGCWPQRDVLVTLAEIEAL